MARIAARRQTIKTEDEVIPVGSNQRYGAVTLGLAHRLERGRECRCRVSDRNYFANLIGCHSTVGIILARNDAE